MGPPDCCCCLYFIYQTCKSSSLSHHHLYTLSPKDLHTCPINTQAHTHTYRTSSMLSVWMHIRLCFLLTTENKAKQLETLDNLNPLQYKSLRIANFLWRCSKSRECRLYHWDLTVLGTTTNCQMNSHGWLSQAFLSLLFFIPHSPAV